MSDGILTYLDWVNKPCHFEERSVPYRNHGHATAMIERIKLERGANVRDFKLNPYPEEVEFTCTQ